MATVPNHLPVSAVRTDGQLGGLRAATLLGVLLAAFTWSWWPDLSAAAAAWRSDPDYGFGPLALVLGTLLFFRGPVGSAGMTWRPDPIGCGLIAVAFVVRMVGAWRVNTTLEHAAMIAAFLGTIVTCCGRTNLSRAIPAAVMAAFALPLPARFAFMFGGQCQSLVAMTSTYLLQAGGSAAVNDAGMIIADTSTLHIADHVTGLKSLWSTVAVAFFAACWIRRPLWQKLVVGLSALPLGLVLLSLHVAGTILFPTAFDRSLPYLGHWFLPAAALVFFTIEAWLLNRVFIDPEVVPVGSGSQLKAAMPIVVAETSGEVQ